MKNKMTIQPAANNRGLSAEALKFAPCLCGSRKPMTLLLTDEAGRLDNGLGYGDNGKLIAAEAVRPSNIYRAAKLAKAYASRRGWPVSGLVAEALTWAKLAEAARAADEAVDVCAVRTSEHKAAVNRWTAANEAVEAINQTEDVAAALTAVSATTTTDEEGRKAANEAVFAAAEALGLDLRAATRAAEAAAAEAEKAAEALLGARDALKVARRVENEAAAEYVRRFTTFSDGLSLGENAMAAESRRAARAAEAAAEAERHNPVAEAVVDGLKAANARKR